MLRHFTFAEAQLKTGNMYLPSSWFSPTLTSYFNYCILWFYWWCN